MSILFALLAGAAVGGVGVLFLLRAQMRCSASDQLELRALVEIERAAASGLREEITCAREERAAAEARLAAIEETFPEVVRALSADAIAASREDFLQQAGERVDRSLVPVQQRLADLRKLVDDVETKRQTSDGRLTEQIDVLASRTGSLADALGGAQTRGAWGEVKLERLLELAGMTRDIDFSVQETTRDADGRLQRPDVVVRLPGSKCVVIDSKTPFESFRRAAAAQGDDDRLVHLTQFARDVRNHVQQLATKGYWRNVSPSPDFVFLFLPGDAYLSAAEEVDRDLFEFAHERGVYLATPRVVMTLLRTIRVAWQNANAAEDAEKVLAVAGELYDRLQTFAAHIAKIGRGLEAATKAYNQAVGSYGARVLVSARRLEGLAQTAGALGDPAPIETQAIEIVEDRPELQAIEGAHAA
jgi:DNA recombination protein RmuC